MSIRTIVKLYESKPDEVKFIGRISMHPAELNALLLSDKGGNSANITINGSVYTINCVDFAIVETVPEMEEDDETKSFPVSLDVTSLVLDHVYDIGEDYD